MKKALGLFAVLLLVAAAPVYAITVEDVIGLSRAGANDAVILSKIDADGTVFQLTVNEIIELKDAGVSDTVITFMINSGKNAGDEEVAPEPVDTEVTTGEPADYSDYGDSGGYATSLDDAYRSSYSVSFGYYYPHWPGYWWSYYYDPFYWPSWSYYYAYCSPYPYWYWYRSPWYGCYPYAYGYYDHHHHYYGDYYYNGPHYAHRYEKDGRHIGGSGGYVADRVYKGPPPSDGKPGARIAKDRRDFGVDRPSPRPGVAPVTPGTRVEKPARPDRRYNTPRPPQVDVRREKPSTPSVNRSPAPPRAPAPRVREEKPARPSKPAVNDAPRSPAPRKEEARQPSPPPAPSREVRAPSRSSGPAPSAPRPAPTPKPGKPREKG